MTILHIDGNSFYASCEQLFRPDLKGKPVAVLTNNDGLIIALNRECKQLGFKRGDVFGQVKQALKKGRVTVFSSNYTLYADISSRINLIYSRFTPDIEFYSIDESFLFFSGTAPRDYAALGAEIRAAVKKETGIPVSVGIGPNKTLAKLCNRLASDRGGVCDWAALDQDKTLASVPVGNIWGVGRATLPFLKGRGINTALDLKHYPADRARKDLTITGARMIEELNGNRAIGKVERDVHQSITVSRSFSGTVTEWDHLVGALSRHTQEAVRRLRQEGLTAEALTVYLMARGNGGGEEYFNSRTASLGRPTSYLPRIVGLGIELLRPMYREDYIYRKVMVTLTGLERRSERQAELFDDHDLDERHEKIMMAMDKINMKYGGGTLRLESSAFNDNTTDMAFAPWEMKRAFLSPAYTTRLCDIPAVR